MDNLFQFGKGDQKAIDDQLVKAKAHCQKVIDTAKEKGLMPIGVNIDDVPQNLILEMGYAKFAELTSAVMMQTLQQQMKPPKKNRHIRRAEAAEERKET